MDIEANNFLENFINIILNKNYENRKLNTNRIFISKEIETIDENAYINLDKYKNLSKINLFDFIILNIDKVTDEKAREYSYKLFFNKNYNDDKLKPLLLFLFNEKSFLVNGNQDLIDNYFLYAFKKNYFGYENDKDLLFLKSLLKNENVSFQNFKKIIDLYPDSIFKKEDVIISFLNKENDMKKSKFFFDKIEKNSIVIDNNKILDISNNTDNNFNDNFYIFSEFVDKLQNKELKDTLINNHFKLFSTRKLYFKSSENTNDEHINKILMNIDNINNINIDFLLKNLILKNYNFSSINFIEFVKNNNINIFFNHNVINTYHDYTTISSLICSKFYKHVNDFDVMDDFISNYKDDFMKNIFLNLNEENNLVSIDKIIEFYLSNTKLINNNSNLFDYYNIETNTIETICFYLEIKLLKLSDKSFKYNNYSDKTVLESILTTKDTKTLSYLNDIYLFKNMELNDFKKFVTFIINETKNNENVNYLNEGFNHLHRDVNLNFIYFKILFNNVYNHLEEIKNDDILKNMFKNNFSFEAIELFKSNLNDEILNNNLTKDENFKLCESIKIIENYLLYNNFSLDFDKKNYKKIKI